MAKQQEQKESAKTPAGLTSSLKDPLNNNDAKEPVKTELESAKTPAGRS